MTPQPALPLTAAERGRLLAIHLADQAAAARRGPAHGDTGALVPTVALLVLIVFLMAGAYSLAAALGAAPAAPWSALGT